MIKLPAPAGRLGAVPMDERHVGLIIEGDKLVGITPSRYGKSDEKKKPEPKPEPKRA
jgi:hypothetical protein